MKAIWVRETEGAIDKDKDNYEISHTYDEVI